MKKNFCFLMAIICLTACSKKNEPTPDPQPTSTIVSFEDAVLDSTGNLYTAPYSSGIISFSNNYDTAYSYWEGFAISNNIDTVEASPYINQYSVISGAAHTGSRFAVAYAGYSIPTEITCDSDMTPVRLFINNSTYVYKTILNGNAYCRAFADGDYYSVTFTGISSTGDTTGTVTFRLADFSNGQREIINSWREVSLATLGKCRRIVLSFASTDIGEYGINTPCYAIIDDFEYTKQ